MTHPSVQELGHYAHANLSAKKRAAVRAHATACAACHAELQRGLIAQRALAGRAADEPTPRELRAWGQEVLTRTPVTTTRRWPTYVFGIAGSVASAAVAAGLVLALARPAQDDGLTARGSVALPAFTLRVLCATVDVRDQVDILDPIRGACPAGAYLKLLGGAHASAGLTLRLFAVRDTRAWQVYPALDQEPVRLLPGEAAPLPGVIKLPTELSGRLRLVAVASQPDATLDLPALAAWATTATEGQHAKAVNGFDALVQDLGLDASDGARR